MRSAGKSILIISIGGILEEAIKAREKLFKESYEVGILSVFKLKNLNQKKLISILKKYDHIITLEEHTLIGGLFSRISEISINNRYMPKSIKGFGIPDNFPKIVGSQSYLRTYYQIDSDSLVKAILRK